MADKTFLAIMVVGVIVSFMLGIAWVWSPLMKG